METFNYEAILDAKGFVEFYKRRPYGFDSELQEYINLLKEYLSSEIKDLYSDSTILQRYPFLVQIAEKDEQFSMNENGLSIWDEHKINMILRYIIFLAYKLNARYGDYCKALSVSWINDEIIAAFKDIISGGFFDEAIVAKYKGRSARLIYEYHIRYYDYLFSRLDDIKVANPHSKEVYFGRDAIFMYKARRSFFTGLRQKTQNRIIYLPFSRHMKEHFSVLSNHFTKIGSFSLPTDYIEHFSNSLFSYLSDNGIIINDVSDLDNYTFVDVGLRGSIPSFLIRVILSEKLGNKDPGIIQEHINNRAMLLFCSDFDKCLGFSLFNCNNPPIHSGKSIVDLCNMVECAPKPTKAYMADCIEKHDHTGKHKAKSKLNNLSAITKYNLFKYIIMRHYYIKGRVTFLKNHD